MSRSSSSSSQLSPVSKKNALNSYVDMDFSMGITNMMRVPEQITLDSVANEDGRSGKKDSFSMEIPERIVISGEENQALSSTDGNESEEVEDSTVGQKVDDSKHNFGSSNAIGLQLQQMSDRLTALEAENRARNGREVILCGGILLYMIFRGISSYAVQNLNRF